MRWATRCRCCSLVNQSSGSPRPCWCSYCTCADTAACSWSYSCRSNGTSWQWSLYLSSGTRVGAAEHPGEVWLWLIPGRGVELQGNILYPVRGCDHDVDRRFGGQAGSPQSVRILVVYAISAVSGLW